MMHAPDLAAEPHLAPAQKAKQSWLDTLRNWGFENAFDLTEDEVVQRYLALDEATKRQAI
jgi:hypothetical protein